MDSYAGCVKSPKYNNLVVNSQVRTGQSYAALAGNHSQDSINKTAKEDRNKEDNTPKNNEPDERHVHPDDKNDGTLSTKSLNMKREQL